uniref:Uncharacterized protein n=1 Tax=Anguilla anguilla TaxID=7936 RepID=A0A0E9WHJ5_ANGAN
MPIHPVLRTTLGLKSNPSPMTTNSLPQGARAGTYSELHCHLES